MKVRFVIIVVLVFAGFTSVGLMETTIDVTAQSFGQVESVSFQILEKCLNGVSSNLEKCLK